MLEIAGVEFRSRLMVGTGKYRSNTEMIHFSSSSKLRVRTPTRWGTAKLRVVFDAAGAGSFTADTVGAVQTINGLSIQNRRRVSDFATNAYGGVPGNPNLFANAVSWLRPAWSVPC